MNLAIIIHIFALINLLLHCTFDYFIYSCTFVEKILFYQKK